MTITPLETRYAGCRFRSRLEARWAVFFDKLGIKWEYEPQGYTVGPSKRPYLPDFRLPELRAFVEVKGEADRLDVNLLMELTRSGKELFTIVLGNVPIMKFGKVPTHALFMPSFDSYWEAPTVTLIDQAYAALEKLDNEDATAVKALLTHNGRRHVACYRGFFIGDKSGWALMPFGMPGIGWTAEELLEPGTVWPILPQPKLQDAYEAARSARFEHGERG